MKGRNRDKDISVTDIGEHYVELRSAGVPDEKIGAALRRYITTLADKVESDPEDNRVVRRQPNVVKGWK